MSMSVSRNFSGDLPATYAVLMWFTLLSAAILHHRKGHVGIVIFRDMMPDGPRNFFVRAIPVLTFIAASSVTVNGIRLLFQTYRQITPALKISMAIPYSAIPVGFFFMAIFSVAQIMEITFGKELPERLKLS